MWHSERLILVSKGQPHAREDIPILVILPQRRRSILLRRGQPRPSDDIPISVISKQWVKDNPLLELIHLYQWYSYKKIYSILWVDNNCLQELIDQYLWFLHNLKVWSFSEQYHIPFQEDWQRHWHYEHQHKL